MSDLDDVARQADRAKRALGFTVSITVNDKPLDMPSFARHYKPSLITPMGPDGWPAVDPSCCGKCAEWVAAEQDQRAYYGPLFAAEGMGG